MPRWPRTPSTSPRPSSWTSAVEKLVDQAAMEATLALDCALHAVVRICTVIRIHPKPKPLHSAADLVAAGDLMSHGIGVSDHIHLSQPAVSSDPGPNPSRPFSSASITRSITVLRSPPLAPPFAG
uniref:Uncharacterized protein n=1 Tax=Oryza meridionalis TaxID=40149 RepID=A0A0E0BXD2_9ORYZ